MHSAREVTQIAAAARRLLDTQLEQLMEVSTLQLRELEPQYDSIADKSLTDQMRKNITLTLLRLSGDEIPEELAVAAFETGQLRAIQQVELIAVSKSFRIDLRVLWEAFLADAKVHGGAEDPAYFAELLRVWEAVEANINEMTEGYRTTSEKIKQQNNELKTAAFQRLLDVGNAGNTAAVAKQLGILSFDPTDPLFCVVSSLREADYAELSIMQARLSHRGINFYFGWQGQYLVGILQRSNLTSAALEQALGELGEYRTGVARVSGPSGFTAAVRNARVLVAANEAPGLRLLHENWLGAIAFAEPLLTDALVVELFAPFRDLSDYVREELTRVIEGFFSTNGTIAAISQSIFRHRNTVRNRLAQVEELTGLKLSTPRDAALLALAFQAWKREMQQHHGPGVGASHHPRSAS